MISGVVVKGQSTFTPGTRWEREVTEVSRYRPHPVIKHPPYLLACVVFLN